MEQQRQYVGIDLHRRRSVIVRRSAEGKTLEVTKVDNDDLLVFRTGSHGRRRAPRGRP